MTNVTNSSESEWINGCINRGTDAVELSGWSVQYASAAGSTWQVTTLSGTLQPGYYYLVQEAQGTGGTEPLPSPDAIRTIALGASNGKVALVPHITALTGNCPSGTSIVDLVCFGSTANCYEGSGPTLTLTNTTATKRLKNGCTDNGEPGSGDSIAITVWNKGWRSVFLQ